MPRRTRITGRFTTAEDLKNTFLKITGYRQAQGVSGDANYWTGGRCNWGGSHNLMEDARCLESFFNSVAGINDDMENIKLSANEEIFISNKQQLINKIQGCISKCRTTSATSVGGICIIWNDFFGSFLKKYLDTFSGKLKRQLAVVEKLEPKHQQELLDLENQASAAKREYEENLRKADDPNLSEQEKAEFIALANKAAKKAEEIKKRIKNNPLTQASNFNFLDDIKALSSGNVPSNVTPDKRNFGNENFNASGSGSSNFSSFSKNSDNQQLIIIAAIAIVVIFLLLNKKEDAQYYEEY